MGVWIVCLEYWLIIIFDVVFYDDSWVLLKWEIVDFLLVWFLVFVLDVWWYGCDRLILCLGLGGLICFVVVFDGVGWLFCSKN